MEVSRVVAMKKDYKARKGLNHEGHEGARRKIKEQDFS